MIRPRLIWGPVLVAVAVVAFVILRDGGADRTVVARFAAATNLVSGANVTAGGKPVGKVDSIDVVDGFAQVRMRIDDGAVWPLHEGTRAEVRWGGTVSYSNRYVDLRPGPARAPALRNGARIPNVDATSPVEIDQLLDTFDGATRRNLGRFVDSGARTLGPHGRALGKGLAAAAPATQAAADVVDQLGDDPDALAVLARQGARTARALRDTQDDLAGVAANAGATFRAIAQHSTGTRATLRALPETLAVSRATLLRLQPTLRRLDRLATSLGPGAGALRRLAGPLATAVATLDDVAPRLRRTAYTLRDGAPAVTALLNTARPVLGRLRPVLTDLAPMVACLRPYATDLAGFGSTWGSVSEIYDAEGHVGAIGVTELPAADLTPASPSQYLSLVPGIGYRFVRPPGYNAGQSWFQPQCGAGPEGLDPKSDPEPRR